MIFKSAIFTSVSGSIGGITFFQSSSGLTARTRTIPLDPNSNQQQAVRSALSDLSNRWQDTVTDAERGDWNTYAANVTLLNALGDPINVSGFNMYIRSNVQRLQNGRVVIDPAPTIFNLGNQGSLPVFSASAATQRIDLTPLAADPGWFSEDGAFGFVFVSRPMNAGINFFRGPWRLNGAFPGDSGVPLVPPLGTDAPFPFVAGQKLGVRHNVTRADGRRTSTILSLITATA